MGGINMTLREQLEAKINQVVNNRPQAIQEGPVILTFYRGAWCPYCNLEHKAYQELLPQIKQKGAQLLAISPQTLDSSLTMKEKMN
jgi:peroxiredoxin